MLGRVRLTVLSTSPNPESRSPESRSGWMAEWAADHLRARGAAVTLLDLRRDPLPPFDNAACSDHPNFALYHRAVAQADGIFLAAPVYNWGLGSGAKSLIELTGSTDAARGLSSAWFDQPVSLLISGGLDHGYLSYGALALGLMTDFRCVMRLRKRVWGSKLFFRAGRVEEKAGLGGADLPSCEAGHIRALSSDVRSKAQARTINPHFAYATSAHWEAPGVPGEWLRARLGQVCGRGLDLSARLRGRERSVWEV